MRVSVIISVFNEEKYIVNCLQSLTKQTFKDFEIIVVDDGSTDKTKAKIRSLRLDNLSYLYQQHQGPAKARNLAGQKARGEVLVFVDADMYFDKNFLRDLLEPIFKGKARGTYSLKEYVANWDNLWARCWNYNWNLPDKKRINPQSADQAKDFRAILKKDFLKVNGFDPTGYTDSWTLFKKLGFRPWPTKAYYYHYNPASLKEVFKQAKWVAKRDYKFGFLGKLIAFFRASPLVSLIIGLKKAAVYQQPFFLIFKLVYDFAYNIGLLKMVIKKDLY